MNLSYELAPQSPEEFLIERQAWLQEAAYVATGNSEADPLEVFPSSPEERDKTPEPDLTPDQEAQLREVAGRFGIGGEYDIPSGAPIEIIEPGKAWKMDAEASIAVEGSAQVYAGTPHRDIADDERAYLRLRAQQSGMPDDEVELALSGVETEYDAACFMVRTNPGFQQHENGYRVVPYGYELDEGNSVVYDVTEQLIEVGTIDQSPAYVLRVDREDYYDREAGKNRFRYRPDTAALVNYVAHALADGQTEQVGVLTSSTYASRAVDAVRQSVIDGRPMFQIGMYGRETLAQVRCKEPQPVPINQITGELHRIGTRLVKLQEAIDERNQENG